MRRWGLSIPGALDVAGLNGGGAIEHVAFECDGYEELAARFAAAEVPTRTNDVPAAGLRQIFLNDPNGVTIELDFRGG